MLFHKVYPQGMCCGIFWSIAGGEFEKILPPVFYLEATGKMIVKEVSFSGIEVTLMEPPHSSIDIRAKYKPIP